MVLLVIFILIVLSSLYTFVHSLVRDYRKPKPIGYRYSDIPSGVNMLELWAMLAIAVAFKQPKLMTVLAVVQVIIGFYSLFISIRHRRPYWFNWI